ncbi:hypothetical protein RYH80_17695 [Halobaculum sp. MBLA0147]|uniref:hypothetical protein n=1 Tax=Halobaculum sp. MBLA0147 TaxID=3079934 RepID=UPI0035234688
MTDTVRDRTAEALRDAVPFVALTAVWIVVMAAVYGLFLVTKPTNVDYESWVHLSVFLVPGVGFLGHVLQQSRKAS